VLSDAAATVVDGEIAAELLVASEECEEEAISPVDCVLLAVGEKAAAEVAAATAALVDEECSPGVFFCSSTRSSPVGITSKLIVFSSLMVSLLEVALLTAAAPITTAAGLGLVVTAVVELRWLRWKWYRPSSHTSRSKAVGASSCNVRVLVMRENKKWPFGEAGGATATIGLLLLLSSTVLDDAATSAVARVAAFFGLELKIEKMLRGVSVLPLGEVTAADGDVGDESAAGEDGAEVGDPAAVAGTAAAALAAAAAAVAVAAALRAFACCIAASAAADVVDASAADAGSCVPENRCSLSACSSPMCSLPDPQSSVAVSQSRRTSLDLEKPNRECLVIFVPL
jgi:hypothetical protein